ncbi:MAG: SUMF1/EgtB/PvdO family nonheme iron enzyme [Anaerolineaceae bacterium]|nr:SUMF1/EgtB/PvdO family nonheme iron enzyme [Anaerolineaceae bacterium]
MKGKTGLLILVVIILMPIISNCTSNPPIDGAIRTKLSRKDRMLMVYVPAGEFIMGSDDGDYDEAPAHTILLDAFWIDQTEVTQGMYAKCTAEGCEEPTCSNDGEDYPVVCITWENANAYCEWAGRRLLTEEEWEKAARGTDGRIYPWGDEEATCDYAIMDDLSGSGNSCGNGNSAMPVGSIPAGVSPYGVLDMAGNVWEWTSNYVYDATNGPGNVLRGGGYFSIPSTLRSSKREVLHLPILQHDGLGFRCGLTANN